VPRHPGRYRFRTGPDVRAGRRSRRTARRGLRQGLLCGTGADRSHKHRGTARKRLLPIETLEGVPLAYVGSAIVAGGRDIGEISSVYGARGFALIRLDRLDEAGDAATQVGDLGVRVVKPSWLFPNLPA